jgi:hypothetical protein
MLVWLGIETNHENVFNDSVFIDYHAENEVPCETALGVNQGTRWN